MDKIIIYGAGGLGKEIALLIDSINKVERRWDIVGFVDDGGISAKTIYADYDYLGKGEYLDSIDTKINVICAIGCSETRELLYKKIIQNNNVSIPTLIDPSVNLGEGVEIGEGSIVCKYSSITVDTKIGKGVLLNIGSLVGHDSLIGEYSTFAPRSMVAGDTQIGKHCNLGAGCFVLEGTKVIDGTTIAPLSGVYKDINKPGVYSGNPARQIR